ncbi:hypothetical protein G9597_004540 [Salmonella enterica]|nr:hypothetical protein [Salmonella enterica]
MKKMILSLSFFMVSNVYAISHKHREELAKSGGTQVQEANGTCNAIGSKNYIDETFVKHYKGMKIVWVQNESVTVEGKPASVVDSGGYGATWQQGIYKIITYKNNKIAVMENDIFKGHAK